MIEEIERSLRRTTKNLRSVLEDAGISFSSFDIAQLTIDTCSNCGIWHAKRALKPDIDGNPICGFCQANE